jgi:hypothetical protein
MDKNTKDVLEAHLYHIRESLADLKEGFRTLTKVQRSQERILLRNTITVEEHKKRSDHLESNQEEFVATQKAMIKSIEELTNRVQAVDYELQPIKRHVKTVSKLTGFIIAFDENKWTIAKIIGFLIAIVITYKTSTGDLFEIFK